jgi:hypothetical protein
MAGIYVDEPANRASAEGGSVCEVQQQLAQETCAKSTAATKAGSNGGRILESDCVEESY